MSPTKPEGKTLKEIKAHKEERKKWKEIHLMKKLKKQKLKEEEKHEDVEKSTDTTTTLPQNKEHPTISIAVAGSILENAQSEAIRAYLAGQIAREACLFRVDEVIVFDDYADEANARKSSVEEIGGMKSYRHSVVQFGRILQYLECPQYLRKYLFPKHDDLRQAGLLNPLEAPHHLKLDDTFEYREGVITNKPLKPGKGSQANVGLLQDVHVDKRLTPGIRCTVKLLPQEDGSRKIKGILVPPTMPKQETGRYWGYKVRLASSLSQVLSNSPYKDGYDVTIGTSDRGISIDEFQISSFNHLLIVFGGLRGLEDALENDETLNVDDPMLLFDHYLNALPDQGCRTIRTEEAIMITLTALKPKLNCANLS